MSSVLKRLRERAEMRALGIDDRSEYRDAKDDLAHEAQLRRKLSRATSSPKYEDKLKAEVALAELGAPGTTRLQNVVRAVRAFLGIGGK